MLMNMIFDENMILTLEIGSYNFKKIILTLKNRLNIGV